MKTFICFTAISALLGACSTVPTPLSPGSATYGPISNDFTVTQASETYTLAASAPHVFVTENGVTSWYWASSGGTPSGYARTFALDGVVAAGVDNGTYFAGISGTLSTRIAIGGTANYSGIYAFVVNGVDQHGPLALAVNFDSGSIVDTSAGIDVFATITGANIAGTVTIDGETGTLIGGFYGASGDLNGAAIGANMAGIFATR